MDGVLVDFNSGIKQLCPADKDKYQDRYDECPHIFSIMNPMKDAVDSFLQLSQIYDTYILSTPPWGNPFGWMHKIEWVKRILGDRAYKRLILTHHKHLNMGDYLIDDRTKNGVDKFKGEHIHFGTDKFKNWKMVVKYLMERI